jgi:pSer/pThr/pTyr-binding forkhead associated (FHA) protein
VTDTPLRPHAATPAELRDRLAAEAGAAPFLVLRDDDDRQVIVELTDRTRLTLGRSDENDVALEWDARVSRTHAALERLGADWTIIDDGLSRNGTWVNGERVVARRRLRDGDLVRVGGTSLAFCAPARESRADVTLTAEGVPVGDVLTAAQRRVLVALCRPLSGGRYVAPASNRQIADELVLAIDTVKGTLSRLFELFEVDGLPQNQKRSALAQRALEGGVVRADEL